MMLFRNLIHFGRLLRAAGLDVPTARLHDAAVALDYVDIRQRGDVRFALRTLCVHRADEIPLFDNAFDLFWRDARRPSSGVTLRRFAERGADSRATVEAGSGR